MKKWYRRTWLIVGGLLLLALIVVIIEWQMAVNRSKRQLEKVRAALDASEPGWQLDQLNERRNAALPPDDQNITVMARKVFEAVPESFTQWERDPQTFDWRSHGKVNHLADPGDVSQTREQFKPIAPLVAILHETRKYSKGGTRLVFAEPDPNQVDLSHLQDFRAIASKLSWSALIAANENSPNRAIEDIRTGLHLRLAIGDEPTIISQLVRMAVIAIAVRATERTIGLTEPKQGLAELQTELEAALTEKFILAGFEGDRATNDRLMRNWVNGSYDPAAGMGSVGIVDFLEGFASSRFLRSNHAAKLELLTAARDAMKRSGKDRQDAMASLPNLTTKDPSAVLARLLLTSTEKVMQAEIRTETNLATMAVAIACERYRQQTGRWPQTLGDIPKAILKAVPDDPYIGRPLKYKRTETGIVVYATGTDGNDDGGTKLDLAGTKPGTDIGVELFDPAHRRKPPLPKEDGDLPDAPPRP